MNRELSYRRCLELMRTTNVGRVAVCTPTGPRIIPVNFSLHDESVVFRTSPYSELAGSWNNRLAFEVDGLDPEIRTGWSVVAQGRGSRVEDRAELALLATFHDPDPWATGSRHLFVRLHWDELTGRAVGPGVPDFRHA